VTGEVTKNNLPDVFEIVKSIDADPFFKKEIISVVVSKNKYTFLLREFDFVIDFGASENIALKLNNFKAFYKKAIKDKTIKTYNSVNLQIASQVICTKK